MAASSIQTKVLIISDTHCAPLTKSDGPTSAARLPFTAPLPKADLLIHAGDLTYEGTIKQYHEALDMLKEIDAPVKLVIAGNHDLSLDPDFVHAHKKQQQLSNEQAAAKIAEARDLWTAEDGRAKREGITYLDEGIHDIQLPNGARVKVYASPYTPEFYDWGFPYERNEDRFGPPSSVLSDAKSVVRCPVPSFTSSVSPIDILITHGPPYQRMDTTDRGVSAGCPHLFRAAMRARPLLHCFGHIHEGHGAERITWSEAANHTCDAPVSTAEWNNGFWKHGVADGGSGKRIQAFPVNSQVANEHHAMPVDVSQSGGNPLRRGFETLMVNASIMSVEYTPKNAPWLIELDLPRVRK